MSEWMDSTRIGPVTINSSATVFPAGNNPSGTSTNVIFDVRGMGTVAFQTITTSSLAFKVYASLDGGTTWSPIITRNSAGAEVAADTAITASTTVTVYALVGAATHIRITRTAGSGTFYYGAHPDPVVYTLSSGTTLTVTAGHGKTLKNYSATISSDTDVVAAVTSKRIKVVAYSIINESNTAVTPLFKSNGTAGTEVWRVHLKGPAADTPMGANLATSAPSFLFATVAGEKLTVDVGSAAVLHIALTYFDDDAT